MKYSKILIGLFLLTITLLLIDILTGIFYWNRFNLLFDSSEFNNISTPIIGLASFIVYSFALLLAIRQNKTILSQNLRPYYEREINRIISDFEKEIVDSESIIDDGKEYNGINYPNLISSQLFELTKNSDYNKDLIDYERGMEIKAQDIKGRSYFPIVLFLSKYTIGVSNIFRYNYLKELVEEIENSKLIEDDKIILKKRIKKEILLYYMSFISSEDSPTLQSPPIPYVFDYRNQDKIEFKKISDSSFREYYDWFKINL